MKKILLATVTLRFSESADVRSNSFRHKPVRMRLVTWNCCKGPAPRKLPVLAALSPSICVIQECPQPPDANSMLWFGNKPRQGIAVTASEPYRISPAEIQDVPPYAFPVQVTGPTSFLLLAIWSQKNPTSGT